jgi:hypothetical protein
MFQQFSIQLNNSRGLMMPPDGGLASRQNVWPLGQAIHGFVFLAIQYFRNFRLAEAQRIGVLPPSLAWNLSVTPNVATSRRYLRRLSDNPPPARSGNSVYLPLTSGNFSWKESPSAWEPLLGLGPVDQPSFARPGSAPGKDSRRLRILRERAALITKVAFPPGRK